MTAAFFYFTILFVLFQFYPSCVQSALPCSNDQDCRDRLKRDGSICLEDGYCSNPFSKGCLVTLLSNDDNEGSGRSAVATPPSIRVCNSDDGNSNSNNHNSGGADYDTDCVAATDFVYPEIRIHNGNWESSIFYAWIIQIILSEVLRVPTTVGLTTASTAASSFHSTTNTLEYSAKAYPFEALGSAAECSTTGDDIMDDEEECTQVLPEVWNGQAHEWTKALQDGRIEPVEGNGAVGKGSWFVPAFTAEVDNSLVSVYGLGGEENRHKLARTFLRPTTWLEYCQDVSPTQCGRDGGGGKTNKSDMADEEEPAKYFPGTPEEEQMYFHPLGYKGYFQDLPQNNCTEFPTTCTGYIVGPSCSWSTNIDAQLFWNDIVLQPDGPVTPNGGYNYSSMIEIWRAANATRSNVIMWWWKPDAMVEEFRDTDAHFQQILLPDATETCSRNRVDTVARCSADINVRRGKKEGACDQEYHALQKALSVGLEKQILGVPDHSRSPGYDFIKAIKLTDLELNSILRRWKDIGVDPYGNDAREAVCGWVVENYDHLMDFIPQGYPRVLTRGSSYNAAYMKVALALGILTALFVMAVAAIAYRYRKQRVFVYAQAHIIFAILIGFLLISIGAILLTLEPTQSICMAQVWLVNLGYSINLVPLLVKIAAINKILSSAKKMKRVKITKVDMLKSVAGMLTIIIIFLIVWTCVDPVGVTKERYLEDPSSPEVVEIVTCSSDSSFWYIVAISWQALLLIMASVLAYQSRDTIEEFNESRSLGTMIYSHFLFLVLRMIVFFLGEQEVFPPDVTAAVESYLLSLDTISALIIYLVPKCVQARSTPDPRRSSSLGGVQASLAVSNIEARATEARVSFYSETGPTTESCTTSPTLLSGSQVTDCSDPIGGQETSSFWSRRTSRKLSGIMESSKASVVDSSSLVGQVGILHMGSGESDCPATTDDRGVRAFRIESTGVISAASSGPEEFCSEAKEDLQESESATANATNDNVLTGDHLVMEDVEGKCDDDDNVSTSSCSDDIDSGGPRFPSQRLNHPL